MVRAIPFGKLQKLWPVFCDDVIFLLFLVWLADLDIVFSESSSHRVKFYSFSVYAQKFLDYEYSPVFLRDSRASETRGRVKIIPREKRRHAAGRGKNSFSSLPAACHLFCFRVGWFSRALEFRSFYYPWGKMGTTRSLRSFTRVVCVNGKHPWILDPTLGIPDSRYWVLDSLLVERGFRYPWAEFRIPTTRHFRTSWFGKKTLKEAL